MKRILTLALALLLGASAALAGDLRLPHIFSDHAVLQQSTGVTVWGWGTPGATVNVSGSWNGGIHMGKVDRDGKWRITILTGKAGGPYTMTVTSGEESIVLSDIMLGEVWICSGQSNMEMPVRGFGFQEVEGSTEAIMEAPETASDIRVFNIKTPKKDSPVDDVDNVWTLSTSEVTANTSAVGYFFAKRLTKALGVPVGIIVNAWGGSRIEPWMTREAIYNSGITAQEKEAIDAIVEKNDRWPETPEVIWNGRVAPIVGYAAKGFLWYQGCSNIGQKCYDKLQAAMVKMWREKWDRGDMPFVFTLLAPYNHDNADGRWRPHFVETQMRTVDILPASWYVCTETLGSNATIHPAKKREVADMMVQRVLQSVYGINPGLNVEVPRLQSCEIGEDGVAKIRLTDVWSDLGSISSRSITGFEMAGEDREFHLAEAEVDWDGQTLIVRCADVPKPVAVRYGFRNWMGANLQKASGIPVAPFRTDDWEY